MAVVPSNIAVGNYRSPFTIYSICPANDRRSPSARAAVLQERIVCRLHFARAARFRRRARHCAAGVVRAEAMADAGTVCRDARRRAGSAGTQRLQSRADDRRPLLRLARRLRRPGWHDGGAAGHRSGVHGAVRALRDEPGGVRSAPGNGRRLRRTHRRDRPQARRCRAVESDASTGVQCIARAGFCGGCPAALAAGVGNPCLRAGCVCLCLGQASTRHRQAGAAMNGAMPIDLLALFGHFLLLSLLSIGGAITVAPDMHRVMVDQMGLLSDAQFNASIAIAQASPGPNVLFVAVMGYQAAGLAGAATTLFGIMLPSTTLALAAARWGHARRDWRAVQAFKAGIAPIVVCLLFATRWVLKAQTPGWHHVLLTVPAALLVWRPRGHLLLLVAAGAVAGAMGWI